MEKPRSSVFLAVSRCGPGQPSCVLGACSSWWRPSDKAAPDPTLSWFCQHPPVKVPSSKQWLSHFLELMAGILPSQTMGSFGDLGVHMQISILQLLPWGHFRETHLYLSHWHCSPSTWESPMGWWREISLFIWLSSVTQTASSVHRAPVSTCQNTRIPVLPDASHDLLWPEESPAPGSWEVILYRIKKQQQAIPLGSLAPL